MGDEQHVNRVVRPHMEPVARMHPRGPVVTPVVEVHCGDALAVLSEMAAESVHCVVTSPPYWHMRDYGVPGQIGLEAELGEYLDKLVAVFQQVRRVLRPDGVAWVNMGDCYAANREYQVPSTKGGPKHGVAQSVCGRGSHVPVGLKPKDMVGQPWRLAFALQADGWYLRQDIIWHKANPMPESIQDRCTKSHEYVFLLSKSERYWFDQEAIKEPVNGGAHPRLPGNKRPGKGQIEYAAGDQRFRTMEGLLKNAERVRKLADSGSGTKNNESFAAAMAAMTTMRNKRSVWTVASQPYHGAHFATFPPDLVKPMILSGCPTRCCPKCGTGWERLVEATKTFESGSGRSGNAVIGKQDLGAGPANTTPDIRLGPTLRTVTIGFNPACECGESESVPGTVLDPFGGSGTVGKVAVETGRNAVLIELNPEYVKLIHERCRVTPGLPL